MAERLSALAYLAAHAGGEARASLAEMPAATILQVQAWPDTLSTVEAVVAQVLGVADLPQQGRAAWFNGGSISAIGAGRFVLFTTADDIAQNFRTAFASYDAALTDLSHARTILRLEGEAAAELLSRCVALDFDARAFPADRVAQTAIHHIDVHIHRLTETSFEIWVLRSFAESLAEWLLDAGAGLGVSFRPNANGGAL
jgi:sarcosine oxidase subunit gamma